MEGRKFNSSKEGKKGRKKEKRKDTSEAQSKMDEKMKSICIHKKIKQNKFFSEKAKTVGHKGSC